MKDLIEEIYNIISGEKRDYDLAIKIAQLVRSQAKELQKETARDLCVRARITNEVVIGEPKSEYAQGYADGLNSLIKLTKLLYEV